MGWTARLKSQKTISEKEIEEIISDLPERYHFCFPCQIRQPWGWSVCCDVYNPIDNRISIGGAYGISGNIAEEFVSYFKNELEELGHEIDIEWSW